MELTIIISYYKAIDNLKIILKALNFQSNNNFEVILSEDDFNQKTIDYISENKNSFKFEIHHLFQKEDNGFRKNNMLNKSILKAKSEKLVFIDGDCIPHKHFVREYKKIIKQGYFYSGRSVLLSEQLSKKILETQLLNKLNLFTLFFSKSKHLKSGFYFPYFSLSYKKRGLLGRNWGVCKKHLLDINGFDEDYITAGVGEDTDIAWRLSASGIGIKSVKNRAIVYHIFHKKSYTNEIVKANLEIMKQKQSKNLVVCVNGIKKQK